MDTVLGLAGLLCGRNQTLLSGLHVLQNENINNWHVLQCWLGTKATLFNHNKLLFHIPSAWIKEITNGTPIYICLECSC